MNRRLSPPSNPGFTFTFSGEPVAAQPGDSLASAMLAAGIDVFSRSIKYHRPRGAWCLAGRCSHCLVRVDGIADVPACTTPAAPGMAVSPQNAYPSAKLDVLSAIDWMFPKGMDHHSMFAGVPVVEGAVSKVARHIAGLAPVPEKPAPADAPNEQRRCDVAIVGAGPAGLACAHALRASGKQVELFDDREAVGGRLLAGLDAGVDLAWAERTRQECEAAGVRVHTRATVLAVYRDEPTRQLAVRLRDPDRLLLLAAQSVVLCPGAVEPLSPFANNDLPGVFAGRGLARLVRRQKVAPGRRAVVVGSTLEALALARLLVESGVALVGLVDPEGKLDAGTLPHFKGWSPRRASGHQRVSGLEIEAASGQREDLDCDLVALCGQAAPSIELARQAGAPVAWGRERGGYFAQADEAGGTREPGIYVAGDLTGIDTAAQARERGMRLGQALASRS